MPERATCLDRTERACGAHTMVAISSGDRGFASGGDTETTESRGWGPVALRTPAFRPAPTRPVIFPKLLPPEASPRSGDPAAMVGFAC